MYPVWYRHIQHRRSKLAGQLRPRRPVVSQPVPYFITLHHLPVTNAILNWRDLMKLFNEGLTDVQRINRRLQAAIDHYPQLAAFRFSLQQPNAETVFIPEEDAVQFVNTLQETISRYIAIRQSEGKVTPPTILRALWGVSTSRDIQMLLLVNSRTFCGRQHQEGQKTILALIRNAWA
ncbi:hypothetical protein C2125_06415 [Rahnella aquatilis]|nr:hypothetical protein C2125_06415 [Rahnella aquatilis]